MTHHKSHVVLLPQGASREWYDALGDYILRFRPTVTQSADDAVSFHGESHTITVIHPASWNRPDAARQPNQEDDIIVWLKNPKNTGNAKFALDVVSAMDPQTLRSVLAARILTTGRFGTGATIPSGPGPTPAPPAPTPTPPTPTTKVTATATDTLNVRAGPGTNYSRLGAIKSGTTYDVVGRSPDSAWLQIPYPSASSRGWISAPFATVSGNLSSVAVVSAPTPPVTDTSQQKLTLVWPSDYKVYTQKFGQRPEYYSKFGLPGHEGVDIRAPNGTNIYACADGVVTLVGWRKAGHPYGYSVRIRHKRVDGEYETIYAHLTEGSGKVNEGATVQAGQLIALADNTGNSSAAHLHLSLKKIGAKNGGYGEIIDPEPFFVDAPK